MQPLCSLRGNFFTALRSFLCSLFDTTFGKIINKALELGGFKEDEEIKANVYAWWHADMPEKIKEGFLNRND